MTAQTRVQWVDAAKGIAILLVVLYHAALILNENGLTDPRWETANAAFATLRMPLFFMASGLFARSIVQRPWPRLWNTRLAMLAWVYVVWSIVRFVYFVLVPMPARPQETSVVGLLLTPVWPSSGLWFLHALFVFFVVSKLLDRAVPAGWQVAGAAVLSLLFFDVVATDSIGWNGMGKYYVHFLIGLHFRDHVIRAVERCTVWTALALVALFGLVGVATLVWSLNDVPGWRPLTSLLAVAAGMAVAYRLSLVRAGRPLVLLGSRTLQVYVAHVVVVAALITLVGRLAPDVGGVVAMALPPVLVALVVPITLALHAALNRGPGRYLYAAPPFVLVRDRAALGGRPLYSAE